MEKIIKKIEQKQKELNDLKNQLDELGKKKYNYLIGRYYCLAASSFIKITGINYVDDRFVNVECLRVTGGKHVGGNIEFLINDDYDLHFIDVDDKRITEVSKEKFIQFLYESLEESKKVALELIEN